MINFENLISKHCLESAKEKSINDLKGYTVIGTVNSDSISSLDLITTSAEFVTNPEGWLDKFNIVVLPSGFNNLMVLVSPECPEVYIAEPSDIIELVESYLSEKKVNFRHQGTTASTWYNPETVTWISNPHDSWCGKYTPGTIIYGGNNDLYVTNTDGTFTQVTSSVNSISYSAEANMNEPGVKYQLI